MENEMLTVEKIQASAPVPVHWVARHGRHGSAWHSRVHRVRQTEKEGCKARGTLGGPLQVGWPVPRLFSSWSNSHASNSFFKRGSRPNWNFHFNRSALRRRSSQQVHQLVHQCAAIENLPSGNDSETRKTWPLRPTFIDHHLDWMILFDQSQYRLAYQVLGLIYQKYNQPDEFSKRHVWAELCCWIFFNFN